MKKPLYLPLIALIFSCGGNESESESSSSLELTYEIDTVMVDAGDHFFFLNWGMGISGITADSKSLINLNPNTLLLEIVDLDQMKLRETVQLEKEGPNGVGGGFIGKLQVLANGNIKLFHFYSIYEINQAGELVSKFEFEPSEWTGYEVGEEESLDYYGTFSPDGKLFFTLLNEQGLGQPSKGFLKMDMENKTVDFLEPGDMFERLDKFTISMSSDDGRMMMSAGESIFSDFIKGDFIVTNSAFNEAVIWEASADSLVWKKFQATLTSNEKTGDFPSDVDSEEALMSVMEEKKEQVEFEKMIYHPDADLFWRFAEDKDRMIADSVVKKQVVTLFDSDFKMLHEQQIDDYPTSSLRFFKDGMLYTFLNIDDEMAFVRLKPMITYE